MLKHARETVEQVTGLRNTVCDIHETVKRGQRSTKFFQISNFSHMVGGLILYPTIAHTFFKEDKKSDAEVAAAAAAKAANHAATAAEAAAEAAARAAAAVEKMSTPPSSK